MRLFRFIILLSSAVLLTACKYNSPPQTAEISSGEEITRYVQELEHLDLNLPDKSFTPLNYKEQRGIWYPFMDYESYMLGKSEDEFRSFVKNMFHQAKEQSFNTVYVHVRPYGDAYYNSQLFPKGTFLDGDYDPLLIMTEEAHSLSLSIHAWINPLRCQTVEEMKNIPDSFTIKKWADSNTGTFINIVNNRYYLNAASRSDHPFNRLLLPPNAPKRITYLSCGLRRAGSYLKTGSIILGITYPGYPLPLIDLAHVSTTHLDGPIKVGLRRLIMRPLRRHSQRLSQLVFILVTPSK